MPQDGYYHPRPPTFAQVWEELMHDTSLSDGAVRLYAHMLWRYGSNHDNHEGRKSMAAFMDVSQTTITNRIHELENRDWVITIKRDGRSNFYHVFGCQADCKTWRIEHSNEGRPKPSVSPLSGRKGIGGQPTHINPSTQVERSTQVEDTPQLKLSQSIYNNLDSNAAAAQPSNEGMDDPDDPGDSDVYAELSGRTKDTIQTKIPSASRSLPNPTIVQPGFKNVPVTKTKPEPKRNTPPTELEQYLLKHMSRVAPNQWGREGLRLSTENREKLFKTNHPDTPEVLWVSDPRFKEWIQDCGSWFITKATKKNQNVLVNLVCKYDTEEHGWYAWCDNPDHSKPLSPAEVIKAELDEWVKSYYDPRKENGMLNVEDEQNHDRMVKLYQDALGDQVK